jgi:hypothetical protein
MKEFQRFVSHAFFRTLLIIGIFVTSSCVLFAQDKDVNINIGVKKEPVWYQQPWAWVVGAAVFILLLVAILRGGKKE